MRVSRGQKRLKALMCHETARKKRVLVIIGRHSSSKVIIFRPVRVGPIHSSCPRKRASRKGLDSRVRGNDAKNQAADIFAIMGKYIL
jgi:hypothetical protein